MIDKTPEQIIALAKQCGGRIPTGRDAWEQDLTVFDLDQMQAFAAALTAAQPAADAVPQGLVEILREAADIISCIDEAHAPSNIRWPISDELHGFSLMLAQPAPAAPYQVTDEDVSFFKHELDVRAWGETYPMALRRALAAHEARKASA